MAPQRRAFFMSPNYTSFHALLPILCHRRSGNTSATGFAFKPIAGSSLLQPKRWMHRCSSECSQQGKEDHSSPDNAKKFVGDAIKLDSKYKLMALDDADLEPLWDMIGG